MQVTARTLATRVSEGLRDSMRKRGARNAAVPRQYRDTLPHPSVRFFVAYFPSLSPFIFILSVSVPEPDEISPYFPMSNPPDSVYYGASVA